MIIYLPSPDLLLASQSLFPPPYCTLCAANTSMTTQWTKSSINRKAFDEL